MKTSAWGLTVRGDGTAELELAIYDQIGNPGIASKDVREVLRANAKAKTINVHINSGGGDVFEGVAIYTLLREHGARVVTHNDALAASSASLIAQAGDAREMSQSAMMMIHSPWAIAVGGSEDLRRHAALLDKLEETFANVYAERTGQPRDAVLVAMRAETWMTADEAKAANYVDTIVPTSMAAAAAWDLSRYRKVPAFLVGAVAPAAPQRKDTHTMKRYDQHTRDELIELAHADPAAFARLRADHQRDRDARASEPWKFKSFCEMDSSEKHALAYANADLFEKLRDDPTAIVK